jgi:glucosamine-phosphate N-acetyltransferase
MEIYLENEQFLVRELISSDFQHGYQDVLADLTVIGDLSQERCENIRKKQEESSVRYKNVVVVEKGSGIVIGNGVLVICPDVFHNGDLVGYIEDIVVLKRMQGKGLGYKIIQTLKDIAVRNQCFKVVLDCSESNEGFYNKCGLVRAALEMDKRFPIAESLNKKSS